MISIKILYSDSVKNIKIQIFYKVRYLMGTSSVVQG